MRVMTLGQLLSTVRNKVPEGQGISGICAICQRETDNGIALKKLVSANFTSWNQLFVGDIACPYCAELLADNIYRKKSWWVSVEDGFATFKNDEALNVLFSPPKPPFYIYIAKRGQRQVWLSALYKINFSKDVYYFSHENYIVPLMFDKHSAKAFLELVRRAREYKITKTELITGELKSKTIERLLKANLQSLVQEIKRNVKNPLWEVIVDVYRD